MRIARLDVDEGFLDGLSIEFSSGLNVLIGARGVGKTSVIEILRFVLGADWFTTDAEARSRQQVLSVLGSGLARVTLLGPDGEVVVMRAARDEQPRASGEVPSITVLAQNEVEAVGAQAHGRLGLVDRFVNPGDTSTRASQIVATLRSLGKESHELHRAIRRLQERVAEFADVQAALAAGVEQQQAVLQSVEATREERDKLEALRVRGAALAAQREVVAAAAATVTAMESSIAESVASVQGLPSWPTVAGMDDLLIEARGHVEEAQASLGRAHTSVRGANEVVRQLQVRIGTQQSAVDSEARELRAALDSLHAGLGQITRHVDELREKVAQREALLQQVEEVRQRLRTTAQRRRATFTDLEELRSERYRRRAKVAAWLTTELHPHVRIAVRQSASRGVLAATIIDLLTGSGLHYNRLAPQIAQKVSALEIVEKVERQDSAGLAELVDIPLDRAQAVVSHLFNRDLTSLLVAPVDDASDLWLLDGSDYKPAANLSIGQRCTAVLPILLRSESDVLIVDQPEDHLDNAFVSGALVSTLRNRSSSAQFIFASHNANIPVLGEADRIIHMESDGRRGFVRHQGALDDPLSVRAVTDVMEGGEEAFRQRAAFYASHAQ